MEVSLRLKLGAMAGIQYGSQTAYDGTAIVLTPALKAELFKEQIIISMPARSLL